MSIPADNPILNAGEDALGRAPSARSFARQVLALDVSRGSVVGVLGKWGSGKTSFVNMARQEFVAASSPVLDFNPWMFSGAEQLVDSFFIELSSQLRLRPALVEIGNDLADYGEAFAGLGWLPVVGPWIERGRGAAKVLGKYLRRRQEGTQGRRKRLEDALSSLEHPIIVVLDDIDRLSTNEIRDVFKLVRLTASFPNITYVVAFDRKRVEQALSEEGVPGRDYLEKILQVAIDLPAIPDSVLSRQIFAALDTVITESTRSAELDQEVWPDVFVEVIRPLIRNMRDVRRYQVAVQGTLDELEDRIALVDLLAMEAIRVFLPDVFREIQLNVDALGTPSERPLGGEQEQARLKGAVEQLIEAGGDHADVVRQLISRLFPFARRHIGESHYSGEWLRRFLRDRRVAHEATLRLYLERVAGEELANLDAAEQAWRNMDDKDAFGRSLTAVARERRQDAIQALETYEDEFRAEHVVPGVVVLWNLARDLPERPRGMFDIDARTTVSRVVYRLLKSLPDHEAVERAIDEILPQLATLSAKREVIFDVGYREGTGHRLVSEAAAERFEADWRQEVRSAAPNALAGEDDLVRVIYWSRQGVQTDELTVEVPDDPIVTLAAVESAMTDTRSQGMGTRAVRRTAVLAWDTLVDVYRDERTLIARIEALRSSEVEIPSNLAELLEKYLGGWRPKDFGGRGAEDDETE
jgi:hypothetical protein